MFTGIIEEIGRVTELTWHDGSCDITIQASKVLGGTLLGDSIAVNGVCLTVTEMGVDWFKVTIAPETIRRTHLGNLQLNRLLNLERALQYNGRFNGHFVQGHVDGTGEIVSFVPEGDALWVTVKADPTLLRYIVTKGYIAMDGTSLTVVDVSATTFSVMLVPYTQNHITLPLKKEGALVNLEVDMWAKYIEKYIGNFTQSPK